MERVGWALVVLDFMGLTNLGMKVAPALGCMDNRSDAAVLPTLFFFLERLRPSGQEGLAANLSDPWLMAR